MTFSINCHKMTLKKAFKALKMALPPKKNPPKWLWTAKKGSKFYHCFPGILCHIENGKWARGGSIGLYGKLLLPL